MDSEVRPPLLEPFDPLSSSDDEDLPLWEPKSKSTHYKQPPCLPDPLKNPSRRSITAKQFKEMSMLHALRRQGAETSGPVPLLPTDIPEVQKLISRASASESDDVVTSKAAALGKTWAAAAREESLPDAELATMLEETLMEEDQEDLEEEKEPASTRKRKQNAAAGAGNARSRATRSSRATKDSRAPLDDEVDNEEFAKEPGVNRQPQQAKKGKKQKKQKTALGAAGPLFNIDLSQDPGTGPIRDRAIAAALRHIGFDSWATFTAHLLEVAEAKASSASGGAATKKKRRRKYIEADGTINISAVQNPLSEVYHETFSKAYQTARAILEQQDALVNKSKALEEHSALITRWSSLTAGEHSWYLTHKNQRLFGEDLMKFEHLNTLIDAEQQEYHREMHAVAFAQQIRYRHLTERQGAQLQTDLRIKRQRALRHLPQYWQQVSSIDLKASPSSKGDAGSLEERKKGKGSPLFPVEKVLATVGEAPVLRQLSPGTSLQGNRVYLPVQLSEDAGVRGASSGKVYRKAEVYEAWDDLEMKKAAKEMLKHNESENGGEERGGVVVCAAAGAMRCLLHSALLSHRPSWEIPLVITEESNDKDSESIKTVFLGKPLLPSKESLREKQQRVAKYASLTDAVELPQQLLGSRPAPRETIYWSTLFSDSKIPLVIRTHGRALVKPQPSSDAAQGAAAAGSPAPETNGNGNRTTFVKEPMISAVFAASTEYLPRPDIEEYTAEELATLWSKLVLTPGADMAAIAHVHVPLSRVVEWKLMTQSEIVEEFEELGVSPGSGVQGALDVQAAAHAVEVVLTQVTLLEPGRYLLKHAAEDQAVQILAAVDLEQEAAEVQGLIKQKNYYDVHTSQSIAGEVDTSANPYVPRRWRPFDTNVVQVPFTFPPMPSQGGRRERGAMRQRQRRLPWGGDKDKVENVQEIDQKEYLEGLEEWL